MFNQSLILPCCITHMSWNVLNAVSINSSLCVLVTFRNKRCQWFQSFCPSSSHLTDYLVSQSCLCWTESVCASTVGSFPLKSRPEQRREAMRTAAKHSNINSTLHITYQLVGRSMFLHGGHHSFVRGGQCFLVGPAVPFEMSSFTDAIIIFPSCFAEICGLFQPVWHLWFFMGVELPVGTGEALQFPVEESSPWVTVRLPSRPAFFQIRGDERKNIFPAKRMLERGWRFHKKQ